MFLEALDLVAEVEVAHGLGAQVHEIDVAGGVFGAFGIAGVMDGGSVEVTVAGVEVEGGKGRKGGERISEGAGHEAGEGFVGGLGEEKAAGAGESFKEAGGAGDGEGGGSCFSEESATAGFVFEDEGDAKEKPVGVGEFRAGALVGQSGHEVGERPEEGSGEGRKMHNRKQKFSNISYARGKGRWDEEKAGSGSWSGVSQAERESRWGWPGTPPPNPPRRCEEALTRRGDLVLS